MSPGYNRRNLRGEVVWEFDLSVNGQQVNVKISNDTGKITEIERLLNIVYKILRQGLFIQCLRGYFYA